MQTTLFEHFKDGHDPEITRTLNIITLFEDVTTGKRGKQVYDYLENHLGEDFEFNHQVWKLDVLSTPSLRELAAKDVAGADILIISVRGDRSFLPEVKSWLDVWVGERGSPVALVALFDPKFKNSECAREIKQYLEEVSSSGQMDFFCEPATEKEEESSVELPPQRRFDFGHFEESLLSDESHSGVPRWGIND
jgi:hypothetical protein